MKKLFLLLTIIASFSFFNSCNDDDGYSLDKFWVARATVHSVSPGVYSFTLDDGTTLWPAAGYVPYNAFSDGQRTYINFTILSDKLDGYDHYIRLNDWYNILTKDIVILGDEASDVYGNDPVKILNMDTGGGYLNVDFGFNYGGGKKHFINLVKNTTIEYPKDGKIYFEFRHNAYNDAAKVGVKSTVSFPLKSLIQEGKESVDLVIRVKTFDGVKDYPITYKWSAISAVNKSSDWSIFTQGIN